MSAPPRRFAQGAFSLVSVCARVLGPLAVLLILARSFAPEAFGRFSLYLAIAGLLGLVGDYGLGASALPDLVESGRRIRAAFRQMAGFRLVIGTATMAVGSAAVLGLSAIDEPRLFIVCAGIALVSGFVDFSLLPLRAVQAYSREAAAALISAAAYVAGVAVAVSWTRDLVAVAVVCLLFRVLALGAVLAIWRGVARELGLAARPGGTAREAFGARLRRGGPYLLDSLLSAAINYVDTLLIGGLLGAAAVGLYQPPAKILQASLLIVQVAASVYLPPLVRASARAEQKRLIDRMSVELSVIGLVAALAVGALAPPLLDRLFGSAYRLPALAWIGFACALWGRLAAAGYGIALIANRRPADRVAGQLLVLLTFATGVLATAPRFALTGVAWSFAAAMGVALSFYFARVRRLYPRRPSQ
ncbi:MAG: oligosaccharide flippase family protein [Burkholderiaceae bacterium]